MSIQWRRGFIPYLPVKAEIGHYVLLFIWCCLPYFNNFFMQVITVKFKNSAKSNCVQQLKIQKDKQNKYP